jgi:HK97 family phage major capsid protein
VRVPVIDDATADFSAEGDDLTPGEPTLSERVVATAKVSILGRVTREQFSQAATPMQLASSLARSIIARADEAFVRQPAPTSPAVAPMAGLVNVAGIVDGGTVADDLDGLVDLVAQLESSGAKPSHILLSPTAWANIQKLKTGSGSNQYVLGAGAVASERTVLGVPTIVTAALTGATGLVVDKENIVSACGPLMIATSEHYHFNSDSVAIRGTLRFGQVVLRPERLGKFTVAAPGEGADEPGEGEDGGA